MLSTPLMTKEIFFLVMYKSPPYHVGMRFKGAMEQVQQARDFHSCFSIIYGLGNNDNLMWELLPYKLLKEIKQAILIDYGQKDL